MKKNQLIPQNQYETMLLSLPKICNCSICSLICYKTKESAIKLAKEKIETSRFELLYKSNVKSRTNKDHTLKN